MPSLDMSMTKNANFYKLVYREKRPQKVADFLLTKGFSKRSLINCRHRGGNVLVNHRRRYNNYLLHDGDEVIFILGNEKPNETLKFSNLPITIVQETANYLIVNKEADLLTIPSKNEDNDSVVGRLLHYLNPDALLKIKPHIITRLDRDTSGLVLVGKNAVAHARFNVSDKQRTIKKYHAIVHGNFSPSQLQGVIDAPIGKKDDPVKRYIMEGGKESVTKYRVIKQVAGASLVELQLFTGRTHQIRVHMQYLGHPLFGDHLYGVEDDFPRQALHCFLLAFDDPLEHKRIEVQIADPADMLQLWQKLSK